MPEEPDALLDSFDEDGDYRPDACSLRISAAVLHRRAELTGLDPEVARDLIEYASDFWALAASIDGRRPELAFGALPDDAPAEVFTGQDGLKCVAAGGCVPSIGAGTQTFSVASVERPETPVASASLIRHPGGMWEVFHVEVAPSNRRGGLASLLYDRIETFLDVRLRPSGWLSEDAYAFWRRRDALAVAGHRRIEPFLNFWISPKQLLNLMIIDVAKIEALVAGAGVETPQRLH